MELPTVWSHAALATGSAMIVAADAASSPPTINPRPDQLNVVLMRSTVLAAAMRNLCKRSD
jgi:hypothetical protein